MQPDLAAAEAAHPGSLVGVADGELAAALADRDPAFRRAAIANVPAPVPSAMRPALATALATDTDNAVALAAANALCFDLVANAPGPILAAIGADGMTRIKSLAEGAKPLAVRDAKRCLTAKR